MFLSCACKDPHLALAYGGRADFRGVPSRTYALLSSQNTALNARVDESLFAMRRTLVNGTFFTAAHVVARSSTGQTMRVTVDAARLNEWNYAWNFANGTVTRRLSSSDPTAEQCGDVDVHLLYSTVKVSTLDWSVAITGQPVYGRVHGPKHRLDLSFEAVNTACAHHGLVGQSYDGTGSPRLGRQDVYPQHGNFTTTAMAEGAIRGLPRDYELGPYDTHFSFSTFGRCDDLDPRPLDVSRSRTVRARRPRAARPARRRTGPRVYSRPPHPRLRHRTSLTTSASRSNVSEAAFHALLPLDHNASVDVYFEPQGTTGLRSQVSLTPSAPTETCLITFRSRTSST